MNGAGNDFVLLDGRDISGLELTPETVRLLCDRKFGVGADGVIRISEKAGIDFVMEYFNSNGFAGTLCGNGARCAARFASLSGFASGPRVVFENGGISYAAEMFDDGNVKFFLGGIRNYKLSFRVKAAGQMIPAHYANSGSPHVVIFTKDIARDPKNPRGGGWRLDKLPVDELGREIRFAAEFAPLGTNVNFCEERDGGLAMRTYERGVEAETLACGTGAVACAAVANLLGRAEPPVEITTNSGKRLTVDFSREGNEIRNAALTGPADVNFSGEIELNN